jgi:hypothetical protein
MDLLQFFHLINASFKIYNDVEKYMEIKIEWFMT